MLDRDKITDPDRWAAATKKFGDKLPGGLEIHGLHVSRRAASGEMQTGYSIGAISDHKIKKMADPHGVLSGGIFVTYTKRRN